MMVRLRRWQLPAAGTAAAAAALLAICAAVLLPCCSSQGLNVGPDVLGANAQATANQFGVFEDLLSIATTGDKLQ